MSNIENFPKEHLCFLREDSKQRDEKNGYDIEKCTYQGIDQSSKIVSIPYKKHYPWIYVKLEDGSFQFSLRLLTNRDNPDQTSPSKRNRRQEFRNTLPHSMLAKGKAVIGAGECETNEKGKIIFVNRNSGHYHPEKRNLEATRINMISKDLLAKDPTFKFELE